MTATTAPAPLTRRDRCDRCGAAAMLRAVLVSGGELLFCGHRARAFGPRPHRLRARLSIEPCETHSRLSPRAPAGPTPDEAQSWASHPG
jgi:hypothetical protein